MTLSQTIIELPEDNFYNPICMSGYLTPLQRQKQREKRNITLSPTVEIFNKPKIASKGIKKAKTKRTPKLKSKEKVIKKVMKHKESIPQVQCSVAGLVGRNKDAILKEKKFFKNRSPQHLKNTKFVMPLTCKKGLDFISTASVRSPKFDVTQKNNSTMDISFENKESDESFEARTENQSNSFNDKAASNSNLEVIETKRNSSSQIPENLVNTGYNQNSQSTEKLRCDILELFDSLSDKEFLERESKARALHRKSLQTTSKSDSSFEDLNESSTSIEEITQTKKLFPIFYTNRQTGNDQICKRPKGKKMSLNFLDNSKGCEQLIIDAGQKEIGAKLCKTCGMIYTIGQEEDEKLHAGYHQRYLINLKFKGWKKECTVQTFMDGRIIQVKDTDENFRSKKMKDILFIVNRDLGFSSAGLPFRPNAMILLFISNDKRVNGCLVAEEIESANPVVSAETSKKTSDGKPIWELGNWYASSETVPAICGVNRIWVSHEFRRRKVASRMVDCLRKCFLFGYFVELEKLAFTDPTMDGREFAASYTGKDNFLVYK